METKQNIIASARVHDTDTGSPEVQVALLTARINHLTEHLKANKNDHQMCIRDRASIRTTLGVDASAIAAHLGGGGHKQAAGCEILGSTDNAKAALLSEVEKVLCRES